MPSDPQPAAAGWGIKLGRWGASGLGARDQRTGDGMGATLLSRVLVLLWVTSAGAEVLVQPDFDAKKVWEASVLCRGWGSRPSPCWKQGVRDPVTSAVHGGLALRLRGCKPLRFLFGLILKLRRVGVRTDPLHGGEN